MKKKTENQVKPSLQEEVAALKRSVGSYKSANTMMRARLEKCKEEAQQEVAFLRIQIDKLNDTLSGKDKTIEGLEQHVNELSEKVKVQADRIKILKSDVAIAEANLEYYKSLPWYKKIFS